MIEPFSNEIDDEVAEALRREAELDQDPSLGMSWEQIKRALGRDDALPNDDNPKS